MSTENSCLIYEVKDDGVQVFLPYWKLMRLVTCVCIDIFHLGDN